MADALDLGSSVIDVGVQVLYPAPKKQKHKVYKPCVFFIPYFASKEMNRRMKKILLGLLILSIIFFIYNYIQISQFYVNRIKLKSSKLVKGLKITQITDFHSNDRINLDKLFLEIDVFQPDIIVLTGDVIDSKTQDLSLAFELLAMTKRITKDVYFVSGNHELLNDLKEEFYDGLKANEIIRLDDKSVILEHNSNKINLLGASFFADEEDYKILFKDMKDEEYNLLLSHSPNRPIKYLDEKTDLILAGHTHGGQVRLPFIGGLVAPGQGLFPKYDKGVIALGNTTLYIDSGLGNSVFPLRLFNRVQITNIEIGVKN